MVYKVSWNNIALKQLKEACEYIRQDSLKSALKVSNDIFAVTDSLAFHPERYPADKFKNNNDGSYRAFILHHYRISYRVIKVEIIILRVRHTSREPLGY